MRPQALRDIDYEVRERGPIERLLDAESTVTAGGAEVPPKLGGVFYPDNGHAFDAVLWYGQEWTWGTIELLMFLVTLIGCGNVTIAAVTVAIVVQVSLKETILLFYICWPYFLVI